jgi:hypothetical protein
MNPDSSDAPARPREVEELICAVNDAPNDDTACRAIEELSRLGGAKAVKGLIDVMTRESCEDEDRARAAARALARYQLAESSDDLVRLLCSTPLKGPAIAWEHPAPLDVRLGLADELAKSRRIMELHRYRVKVGNALVASEDPSLRARIAEIFARFSTGSERLNIILDSVLHTPSVNSTNLDQRALTTALDPHGADDRQKMVDRLVTEATKHTGKRSIALIAGLLILITGNTDDAGQALNEAAGRLRLKETQLRALRIQVGGEIALTPLLRSIQNDLENYFRKPLHELRRETEQNWQQTMRSAQHAFTVRVVMSVLVFLLGLVLVGASAVAVITGHDTGTIFGPGVSLVSGLGTMLLVIYTGPLKDIRVSVADLGSANAAFIAYVHRVSEISHTFSAKYLAEDVNYEDLKISCTLLSDASKDAIKELQPDKPKSGRSRLRSAHTVGAAKAN